MMLLGAVLATGLSATVASGQGLDDLTAEIDRLVLSGRSMPPALLLDLRRLPDAGQRMQAVVYLRRSGLLTGGPLDLDDVVFLPEPAEAADVFTDGATDGD
ncbi:hypothetical protein [Paracoccus jeotgali]|uniref:hypothetical protein n=1 Tax=Paracoccus jeotgali TaxID=2065379 RepID=UPI0028AC8B70|nr:hypothetical protein [Paracoccus jeotgali]